MVVDPATGTLWLDQEIVGLWKMTTDLTSPQLVHKLTRFGQKYSTSTGKCVIDKSSTSYGESYLPGDLEGISLYRAGTGSDGYLIISNQNASLFTVFSRDGKDYLGSFTIGAGSGIDAVQATDGLDVINVPMGSQYPQGLLVTQDGKDTPEGGTNFKFTPWRTWPASAWPVGRHERNAKGLTGPRGEDPVAHRHESRRRRRHIAHCDGQHLDRPCWHPARPPRARLARHPSIPGEQEDRASLAAVRGPGCRLPARRPNVHTRLR